MSKDLAVLPKGWKISSLGEVCNLRRESINPTENLHFPYVGLEHIDSGVPNLLRFGKANEVKSSKSKFYPNDVLYGKLRPYLDKAAISECEGFCSTDILVIQNKTNFDSYFLVYLLHTNEFLDHAIRTTKGVNHPRTSWQSVTEFIFSLPPLEEQRAIATTLRTIQTAKEARQKELALERERKAALMDYLFTHGTRNEPRKQTELGEIPESWDISKLGDLGEINGGGTPSTKVPEYWNGEIAWLVPSEVTKNKGIYISKTVRHITQLGLNDCASKLFPIGTVMMTSRATIGEVVINQVPMATNQGFINIGCHENLTDNEFLGYWIKKNKTALEALGSGVTFKEISRSTFKTIKISLPPLDEQKTIANVLSSCDAKIATLEREINLHDELFRAMLEEFMTGQLSSLPLAN